MKNARSRFQYDNQNFLELASIQSAALGLSVIIIGKQLAQQYGVNTTICSICVGNLILWLIGIAVISMSDRIGNTGLDNIKDYFGSIGGILAALILLLAFISWYAFQLNFSMNLINQIFHIENNLKLDLVLRIGATLGLICALLSIGGIRMLRRIAVVSLPFLFAYHIYGMIHSGISLPPKGSWALSFPAIVITILTLLPGVINFPTFFRHSRSKAHSFLALSLLTIFITFFEISTIWINFNSNYNPSMLFITLIFIMLILTLCNMLNIYLASACWEMIVAKFASPKGFAIIGLLGTLTYTFLQISAPVQFLQNLTNSYIACVGVTLLMGYLTRMIVKHRPRNFEKAINLACWLFGCLIATISELNPQLKGVQALLSGLSASTLFFMGVIFIEEISWSIKKKIGNNALKTK